MSETSRRYHEDKMTQDDRGLDNLGLQRTNTFLSLSPEQFEKLYLSPQNRVKGDLRQSFANPTPVAVMGFCVALLPLSVQFMGWRGAGGVFTATVGANVFFGGMLLILAGIGEFILGNTFPSVVFFGYGAHFLTFSATFIPWFAAVSSFNVTGATAGTQTLSPGFLAGFGFYGLSMTMLSFIFLICSLRTNVAFVLVFVGATMGFGFATGTFWTLARGNAAFGALLLKATGGCFFACVMFGWYLLFAIMMAAVDMPFAVPVGDLSTVITGMSERNNAKINAQKAD